MTQRTARYPSIVSSSTLFQPSFRHMTSTEYGLLRLPRRVILRTITGNVLLEPPSRIHVSRIHLATIHFSVAATNETHSVSSLLRVTRNSPALQILLCSSTRFLEIFTRPFREMPLVVRSDIGMITSLVEGLCLQHL